MAKTVGLTPEELAVSELLVDFVNGFRSLPRTHPADLGDVVFHVHALQNILMSRCAQRCHPAVFPVKHG